MPDHFVPAAHKEIEEDFRDDSVTKIIYRKNDKVVGFIIYKIGNDLNGELLWLGVDPDYQGQSIGNKLMKFLLNDMKNKKVNEINISVVASTVDFEPFRRTRKFYEQFGFMETRIDKDYYDTGVDRSIMSLKP